MYIIIKMKLIKNFLKIIIKLLNLLKIISLKTRGIHVDLTCTIHWSSVFETNGGSITIGPRTNIDRGVILRAYGGDITVGSDCRINPYTILYGDGGLKIGNAVRIAAHSIIVSANHNFSDTEKYIYLQGESKLGITIGDDVWIGAGAKILDGLLIETGTVIGAGSVVTKSTEAFSVVVGVPAIKISSRLKVRL